MLIFQNEKPPGGFWGVVLDYLIAFGKLVIHGFAVLFKFMSRLIKSLVGEKPKVIAQEINADVKHNLIKVEKEIVNHMDSEDRTEAHNKKDLIFSEKNEEKKMHKLEKDLEQQSKKVVSDVIKTIKHVNGEVEHIGSKIVHKGKKETQDSVHEVKQAIHKLEETGAHIMHKGNEGLNNLKHEAKHQYNTIEGTTKSIVQEIKNVVQHTANQFENTIHSAASSLNEKTEKIESAAKKETKATSNKLKNLTRNTTDFIEEKMSAVSNELQKSKDELADFIDALENKSGELKNSIKSATSLSDKDLKEKFNDLKRTFDRVGNKIKPKVKPQSIIAWNAGIDVTVTPFNDDNNILQNLSNTFGFELKTPNHVFGASALIKMHENDQIKPQYTKPSVGVFFLIPNKFRTNIELNFLNNTKEFTLDFTDKVQFDICSHAQANDNSDKEWSLSLLLGGILDICLNLNTIKGGEFSKTLKTVKLHNIIGFVLNKILKKKWFKLYEGIVQVDFVFTLIEYDFVVEIKILCDSSGIPLFTIKINLTTLFKDGGSHMFTKMVKDVKIQGSRSLHKIELPLKS